MRTRVTAGLLAIVLGACSGPASTPSPSPDTSTTLPAATTSTAGSDTDRFLSLLDRLLSEAGFAGALDEAEELVVAVGERMCRLLDVGLAVEDILTIALVTVGALEADGESAALGGILLGAAISELCPRHLELLEPLG